MVEEPFQSQASCPMVLEFGTLTRSVLPMIRPAAFMRVMFDRRQPLSV
jgi:hypothetical protein